MIKKNYIISIYLFLFACNHLFSLETQAENNNDIKELLDFKKKEKKRSSEKTISAKKQKTISLNYINEDITNIINQLSALKRINILFPQPPAKITGKITFAKYEEVTIDEAWDFLATVMDLIGYSFIKKDNVYQIVKNDSTIREPLPLYVNSIYQLPNSDEKVRYIYFFNNLDVHDPSTATYANIDQILKDMFSNEPEGNTHILDTATNSIIVSGRANAIKGVMKIIYELDVAGFPETIEVVPLLYTRSDFISKIISQLIPTTPEPQFRYGPFPVKPSKIGAYHFSEQTKIVPIDRTNSLAILGPPDSVKRLREFISKYLDQPVESEKSIIYVKTLQYLNADELAPVIKNLITAKSASAQAEASTSGDSLANAIIVAEKFVPTTAITQTDADTTKSTASTPPSSPFAGGNRLIIAARHQDRVIIDKLIDELDQPQVQVAIEVLIADITITDNHLLGAQIRNAICNLDQSGVNFQAAHLITTTGGNALPWLNYINDVVANGFTPEGIASDLLAPTDKLPYNVPPNTRATKFNIASLSSPGSTIISFKNGNGIAAILQVLDSYNSITILSQPFVITKNNFQANITVLDRRLVQLSVDVQSTGGPAIRRTLPVEADLSVKILPRLSKGSDINLEILVNVNNFTQFNNLTSIFNMDTRQVRTNANLKNKEVLVIGGLARVDSSDTIIETPLLSKIPLIGYLFKRKNQAIVKRDLMIFISPTIIRPRIEGGSDTFTENKTTYIKREVLTNEVELLGTNFENLRDPVTRIFFTPLAKQVNQAIDYYTEQRTHDKEGAEKELEEGKITPREAEEIEQESLEQDESENLSEDLAKDAQDLEEKKEEEKKQEAAEKEELTKETNGIASHEKAEETEDKLKENIIKNQTMINEQINIPKTTKPKSLINFTKETQFFDKEKKADILANINDDIATQDDKQNPDIDINNNVSNKLNSTTELNNRINRNEHLTVNSEKRTKLNSRNAITNKSDFEKGEMLKQIIEAEENSL